MIPTAAAPLLTNPVADAVEKAVKDALAEGSTAVLEVVARAVSAFAVQCIKWLFDAVTTVTQPDITADFMYSWTGKLFAISLPLIVAFMVFQVGLTMVNGGGWSGLGRAVSGAGVAVFGTTVSIPVISLLVVALDKLADGLMTAVLGDMSDVGGEVAGWFSPDVWSGPAAQAWATTAPGGAGLAATMAGLFFGVVTALSSLAVGAALLLRTVILYITVVATPLMLMGMVWEPTRVWPRRWASMIVALLFTKIGIVVVLGLGISAVRSLADPSSSFGAWIGTLLAGVTMFALGAFVPGVCMRFFAFLGDEVGAAVLSREAHGGMSDTLSSAGSIAGKAPSPKQLLERLNRSGPPSPRPSPDVERQETASSSSPVPTADQTLSLNGAKAGDSGAATGSAGPGITPLAESEAGRVAAAPEAAAATGAGPAATTGVAAAGSSTAAAAAPAVAALAPVVIPAAGGMVVAGAAKGLSGTVDAALPRELSPSGPEGTRPGPTPGQ